MLFIDFLLALKNYRSIKIDFTEHQRKELEFSVPYIVDVSFPYSNILTDVTHENFEILAVSAIIE